MALVDGALTMEARGINKRKPLGILIALLIIGAAVGLAVKVASRTKLSTDDASIDAEVIHVASAVGGRIIELPIHENERVHKGDLLFRIDPMPYQTNVAAAEAQLALSPTRRRLRDRTPQVLSPKPKNRRLLLTIWSMMSPLRKRP